MKKIQIIPIGGVAEIGSNMFAISDGKTGFFIDCGILFPYDNFYGLNYLIPNFYSFDKELYQDIVFTHGHEDHIGAVTHLIEDFPAITYHASEFTDKLIQRKLNYKKLRAKRKLFTEESVIKIGDFTITPIHVNHSIPETFGMHISHSKIDCSFFYASDFKYDEMSPYEKPFDLEKLKPLMSKTKNFALLDSTNILNEDKTISEKEVLENLEKVISNTKKRVFVTLFSSNIHRVQSLFNIAKKTKRKVFLSGRSLQAYSEIAIDCGLLNADNLRVNDQDAYQGEQEDALILISGCQGDFFSSLTRYSAGQHKIFKPNENDLVLFSSKVIPGNEKSVFRIVDSLSSRDVELVLADKNNVIHASGHPAKQDLKTVISSLNISDYIPIHGNIYFLKKQIEFLNKEFSKIKTHYMENFYQFTINEKLDVNIKKVEALEPILIHGNGLEIERENVRQRRKLATLGLVTVNLSKQRYLVEINTYGMPTISEKLTRQMENQFRLLFKRKKDSIEEIAEEIRILTRRQFNELLGYKPITMVNVL